MRRSLSVLFAAIFLLASQSIAEAKQRFSLYEGPDSIKVGKGGTRIEKNGIQYWLQGAPTKPFKVIGIFDDSRKDRWWDGDAIGSKSIAKQVLTVGASAVIVLNQDTKISSIETFSSSSFSGESSFSGSFSNWSAGTFSGSGSFSGDSFGSSTTFAINRTTTRLLVVRYLTDEELADLKTASPDALKADSVLPSALQERTASPEYRIVRDGPAKRPARTPSGFCYEVPRDYRGLGSLNKPALSTNTPACWQVEGGGQN